MIIFDSGLVYHMFFNPSFVLIHIVYKLSTEEPGLILYLTFTVAAFSLLCALTLSVCDFM